MKSKTAEHCLIMITIASLAIYITNSYPIYGLCTIIIACQNLLLFSKRKEKSEVYEN